MKRTLSLLLFLAGLGALFGTVWWLRSREPELPAEAGRQPFFVPVTAAEVRRDRVAPEVLVTGNVRSANNAALAFEVSGRLLEILVDDASVVARGDVLARLDDRDAQVALLRAQAAQTLEERELDRLLAGARGEEKRRLAAEVKAQQSSVDLAGRELERGRDLAEDRIISPSQLDVLATTLEEAQSLLAAKQEQLAEAEAGTRPEDIEVARAELGVRAAEVQEAELAVEKTVLVAPFDGVVSRRLASIGDPVAARDPVFELVDLGRREIVAEIPARYAARLSRGATIEITADDLPGFRLETVLDALVPVAESSSGNLRGIARLTAQEDPAQLLSPGFFVRMKLALEPLEDVLIVPADALRLTGSGEIVVRLAPGDSPDAPPVAQWVPVKKLAADRHGVAIEVLSPQTPGDPGEPQEPELKAGDRIVVSGVDRAFPGAGLLVRETSAPQADSQALGQAESEQGGPESGQESDS